MKSLWLLKIKKKGPKIKCKSQLHKTCQTVRLFRAYKLVEYIYSETVFKKCKMLLWNKYPLVRWSLETHLANVLTNDPSSLSGLNGQIIKSTIPRPAILITTIHPKFAKCFASEPSCPEDSKNFWHEWRLLENPSLKKSNISNVSSFELN